MRLLRGLIHVKSVSKLNQYVFKSSYLMNVIEIIDAQNITSSIQSHLLLI